MKRQQGLKFFFQGKQQCLDGFQFYDNMISERYLSLPKKEFSSSVILFGEIESTSQDVPHQVMKNIKNNKDRSNQILRTGENPWKMKSLDSINDERQNNNQELFEPKIQKDEKLQSIFQKINNKSNIKNTITTNKQIINTPITQTPFNFNKRILLTYPKTPHFQSQLQSPLWKFNSDHRDMIDILRQQNTNLKANKGEDITSINLDENPIKYAHEGLKYFLGLAMKMKQMNLLNQSRIFLKLGVYVEPFNELGWRKYIQFEEANGEIYKSLILSKTAFLFTLQEEFGKSYINNADKCGLKIQQMYGILSSVSSPQSYERTLLVDLAKIELKSSKMWKQKGLKILSQICFWNDYKLPVCSIIIFLARLLENYGYRDKALQLLKRSFNKTMSKLEIYTIYVDMLMRQENGNVSKIILQQILIGYSQFVSGENRYRLYMQLAEILFRRGDISYSKYVVDAYENAKRYCAAGTGCNKILRNIYFTVAKWKNANVIQELPVQVLNSDQVAFETNRYVYVNGLGLAIHNFTDWKYYLHYGLERNIPILQKAMKMWPQTGRLVAQWIHCLRAQCKFPILQILQIWRQKIQEVPKSGELWCQGGRIYIEIKDYFNASKCFRFAIHFTPQYADSFIEELKILLLESRFQQVQKLKKLFFIYEPFYGHVFSYLKVNGCQNWKPSLKCIWDKAVKNIKEDLYKYNIQNFKENVIQNSGQIMKKNKQLKILTAYTPYNEAYLKQNSQEKRTQLFMSYQQMENKN